MHLSGGVSSPDDIIRASGYSTSAYYAMGGLMAYSNGVLSLSGCWMLDAGCRIGEAREAKLEASLTTR